MLQAETTALLEAASLADRAIERSLAFANLSTTQYRLMEHVGATPGIQPSVLAARLLQESHSVSGLLNRLEDRGLIARANDRQDRRVIHVRLTREGDVLLLACREKVAGAEAQIQAHLVDGDNTIADFRDRLEARLVTPLNQARRRVAID